MSQLDTETLQRMNVGKRYQNALLSDFNGDKSSAEAHRIVKGYVNTLKKQMAEGWGLYIYGPNGSGKTHLASAILLAAMQRHSVLGYALPADLLREEYIERRAFDDRETIVHRCETVPLLFLDDVGKEYAAKSGWAELVLENLIRKRVRELRPTIVTSNLSLTDFRARYQESAFSLLLGSMIPVMLNANDRREKQLKEKLKELRGE